jgi:hypothetical protein
MKLVQNDMNYSLLKNHSEHNSRFKKIDKSLKW